MPDSDFSKRMKMRRNYLKLLQKDIAEKTGIDHKYISKYENGSVRPQYEALVEIAKVLKCSTDYLLGRTDNPNMFLGDVDGHHYEIELEENEPDKPYYKHQYDELVRKLEAIGFDVAKLQEKDIEL